MKRLGRWAAVFIYVLAVAIFCAYYLFPSETVKTYVAARIQRVNPRLSLSIGDASGISARSAFAPDSPGTQR